MHTITNSSTKTHALGIFLAGSIIIMLTLFGAMTAFAAPEGKVTICHATSSVTNPFVTIHVSANAINGHFENNGTTKAGHEGDLLFQGEVECPGGNPGGGGQTGSSTPISGSLTGTVVAPTSTATTTTGGGLTGVVVSPTSTLTGTVVSPTSTLTGVVVSPTTTLTGTVESSGGGGGGGGNGGGGGGGGNSPAVIDYCPNIAGVQTSLPAGQGIANGICVALGNGAPGIPNTGGVGGGNGEVLGEQTPGVPNTGAGGNAPAMWFLLGLSALAALGSGAVLARGRLFA